MLPTQVPETLSPAQLRYSKSFLQVTWDQLAEKLGVVPRTVYMYDSGERKIPKWTAKLVFMLVEEEKRGMDKATYSDRHVEAIKNAVPTTQA